MSTSAPTPSKPPSSSAIYLRPAGGRRRIRWTINVALGAMMIACGAEEESPDPSPSTGGVVGTGGAAPATGGIKSTPTGGTVATGGSGGTATGGALPTGGTVGSGGSAALGGNTTSGGSAGAGGAPVTTGGTTTTGGSAAKGGTAGSGGASAGAGGKGSGGTGGVAGGTGGTGGAASGTCQKGTTKGNEVLFIGESFIAGSSIPEETTKLARAAGSLGANDSYVDKSVSGTWIGNGAANSIPNQYKNNSNGVRFVLMNGGGNDCWMGGQETHRTAALNAAKTLFQDMQTKGVEKIVYFFYPDPIGAQHANLTACLNLLRPDMKALCEGQTAPKCYWVDLRETWNGHPEYAATDGIHVAGPGNAPTAGAIFKSMQANCVAP